MECVKIHHFVDGTAGRGGGLEDLPLLGDKHPEKPFPSGKTSHPLMTQRDKINLPFFLMEKGEDWRRNGFV